MSPRNCYTTILSLIPYPTSAAVKKTISAMARPEVNNAQQLMLHVRSLVCSTASSWSNNKYLNAGICRPEQPPFRRDNGYAKRAASDREMSTTYPNMTFQPSLALSHKCKIHCYSGVCTTHLTTTSCMHIHACTYLSAPHIARTTSVSPSLISNNNK